MNFETAFATAGRAAALTKARFVCVSVDPSLNPYENPKKYLLLGNEYKKVKSEKTICFSREKFSVSLNEYAFFDFSENPR